MTDHQLTEVRTPFKKLHECRMLYLVDTGKI